MRKILLHHRALLVVALLYLLLANVYGVVNPIFESPDENWHYLYARNIAEGNGLPIQPANRDGSVWSQQEASQAPLYYLIGAAAISWIPFSPLSDYLRPNPHASIGSPAIEDNKNRFVHDPAKESFPYSSDALAVHIIRLISTLFGLGLVVATYATALEMWPARQHIALGTAVVAAFLPQFLYISSSVNNDVAVSFFSALAFWLIVRSWHRRCSMRFAALSGLVAGLAALSKLSGFGIAPLLAGAVFVAEYRRDGFRGALLKSAATSAVFLATISWWLWRNLTLYGELLPLKAFLRRETLTDQWPSLAKLLEDAPGLVMSFWGFFGWFSIPASDSFYYFFHTLALAAVAGLLVVFLRIRALPPTARWGIFWAFVWLLVTVAALLRYHLLVQAFQGRLLFPALSAIAILLFFGLHSLVPAAVSRLFAYVLGLAIFGVALLVPFIYIAPAYAPPIPISTTAPETPRLPAIAHFDETVDLIDARQSPGSLRPGGTLELTLHWKVTHPLDTDYSVFVHLLDWKGRVIAQKDTYPGGGNLATSLWRPWQLIGDVYRISVPPDLPAPAVVQVETGLYHAASLERLSLRTAVTPSHGSAVLLPRLSVRPNRPPDPCPPESTHADFAAKALLQGFRLTADRVAPGDNLTGQLCWQAIGAFDRDYTVFVQLIGPAGLVAQDDAQPRRGAFPTSAWQPGDLVAHEFSLPLSKQMAPGRYQLIAGLYDASSGLRLPTNARDFVDLRAVDVAPRPAP